MFRWTVLHRVETPVTRDMIDRREQFESQLGEIEDDAPAMTPAERHAALQRMLRSHGEGGGVNAGIDR